MEDEWVAGLTSSGQGYQETASIKFIRKTDDYELSKITISNKEETMIIFILAEKIFLNFLLSFSPNATL